jgi:hypothetical protein
LLPFRSKYPPQHSVLKNPQSMFLPQSEKAPSFAPIQHNRLRSTTFRNFSRYGEFERRERGNNLCIVWVAL